MDLSRRQMLASTAVAAGVGMLASRSAEAQNLYKPTPILERKDVSTLLPDDPIITAYRNGVAAMRALPDDDPLSWQHQATIHNNFCPHQNWFFLSWHRAYLHQLEDIIRKLSGDETFAMPYWDWTRNAQIPAPFWGDDNALNHPRSAMQTTNMPAEFVGETVIAGIMEITDFELFASVKSTSQFARPGQSRLESTPHNVVHGVIGGDMATFMSPLDPIFWLHHCNVDRIWASWNEAGNPNTSDPDLRDFVYSGTSPDRGGTVHDSQFVDRDGAARDYAVADMESTEPMGYRYDRLEPAPETNFVLASRNIVARPTTSSTVEQDLVQTAAAGAPLVASLAIERSAAEAVAETGRAKAVARAAMAMAPAPSSIDTAILTVRGLKAPAVPSTAFRVFLNCDYLSVQTPINDPHYVASAAFFVSGDHGHGGGDENGHGVDYVFDLTETIDALRRSGVDIGSDLRPQLIAITEDGSGAELEIDGKLEINIQSVG